MVILTSEDSPYLDSRMIRTDFRKTDEDIRTIHDVGLADHPPSSRVFGQLHRRNTFQRKDRPCSRSPSKRSNGSLFSANARPQRRPILASLTLAFHATRQYALPYS